MLSMGYKKTFRNKIIYEVMHLYLFLENVNKIFPSYREDLLHFYKL